MNKLCGTFASMAALLALAAAVPAAAQGGFGQMPPEVQAKMKAWQKFRETHKNYDAIRRTMTGIRECEKDPKTQLSKDQAKRVLGVIAKYEKKPVLTNDEAGQANKAMTEGLTVAQIKAIATTPDMMRGGRGFGGGARARGGPGGGRPGGGFNMAAFPDPKEYNPLNPETLPFAQFKDRAKQMMGEFKTKLQAATK